MAFLKTASMAIAFLLELCMIFALGYYGFYIGSDILWKLILTITLPAVAIGLWGYFAAPKSAHRLQRPYLPIFKLVLYITTAFLLYKIGVHHYPFILASAAILSESLAWALHQ
ncbi:MAG: hypothetical protein JWR38_2093 [Mucilaginibacter sp.]|nr:hypothetical protein [Mucilaginibacter sp.]